MPIQTAANLLIDSILISLAMATIASTIVAINNIFYTFWNSSQVKIDVPVSMSIAVEK
jgi:hypothetical protein